MSTADLTDGAPSETGRPSTLPLAVAVAGFASLGAGAIHAAAMGAHAEHRQAVFLFALTALFQLGWGVVALLRPHRLVLAAGAAGNAAAVVGWAVAKTVGLGFVNGLETVEKIQVADAMAAGLALTAVLAVVVTMTRRPSPARSHIITVTALAAAALAFPGMVAAGNHVHAHDETVAAGHSHTGASADATPVVVPPKVYDPTKPIDLGGVPGVTPEEQARAENLVAVTLYRLPQFADTATAEAHGYHSIGDAVTGFEHFINWTYINDDKTLDPDYPESLVYRVERRTGTKTLEAAMYMLPEGQTLATVPDVGGKLTQWHIHDNLCFTPDTEAPRVAGLTQPDGTCRAPLVKLASVPMIHVWIVPHACGPFAALEGVGAGQIAPGETRLCDHAHGGTGTTF